MAGDKPTRVGPLVDEYSLIEEGHAGGMSVFKIGRGLEFSVYLLEKNEGGRFFFGGSPL